MLPVIDLPALRDARDPYDRPGRHVRAGRHLGQSQPVPIRIHSTDTAGYSDIIFALFDLLGLQFAPRLSGLPDTRLWFNGPGHDSPAGRLLKNRLKLDLIHRQWDELLRVAGSLDQGTVTASLLVARLHAQQRRSMLAARLRRTTAVS
jgi:TnpA family transposase